MLKKFFSFIVIATIGMFMVSYSTILAMETKEVTLRNIKIDGDYIVGANYNSITLDNVQIGGIITFESNDNENASIIISEDSVINGIIFNRGATVTNNGYIKSMKINNPVQLMKQGNIDYAVVNATSNVSDDGQIVILRDGKAVNRTGGMTILDDYYYASSNYTLAKGITNINGKMQFFDNTYVRKTGFVNSEGNTYHIDSDGNIAKGLTTISGKKYYFNNDGIMQKGIVDIEGKKYSFKEDGSMLLNAWADEYYRADYDGVLNYSRMDNSELDKAAGDILARITNNSMTEREKMFAVFKWMQSNIGWRGMAVDISGGYTHELTIDLALYAYKNRKSSCEHYAALEAVLIKRLGYKVTAIGGERLSKITGLWGEHSWIKVSINGVDYHFDPLYVTSYKLNDLDYFLVTESVIKMDHRW